MGQLRFLTHRFLTRGFLALATLCVIAISNVYAEDTSLNWAQLTEDQHKVLSPLASEWDTLRPWQIGRAHV